MYDAYFNFLFLPMTISTLKKIQRVTEPILIYMYLSHKMCQKLPVTEYMWYHTRLYEYNNITIIILRVHMNIRRTNANIY